MNELVLKSIHDPQDFSVKVFERPGGIRLLFDVPDKAIKGVTISFHEARLLRDFLNEKLGEQVSEPMGSGPRVYLEKFNGDDTFWVQFPTEERAREYAMKRAVLNNTQMIARCHQTLVPVTITATTYEWKDI